MPIVHTIYSQPFYDNMNKCYTRIYVIDRNPEAPLSNIIRRIQTPRLSPFQTSENSCALAIYNPNQIQQLLQVGEEAILFTYLLTNGYTIDTSLTKLLKSTNNMCCSNTSSSSSSGTLLCLISK